jgi:lysozyme
MMTVPQQAVDIAKHFEGFSPVPYICPAGFWTVGYGHLCNQSHPSITEDQGELYLQLDMQTAHRAVLRYCPVEMSEQRLAALIDFTFNLGVGRLQTSTLRKRVNEQNWSEAVYEIKRWVYGGGRVLPGLVKRRAVEAVLLGAI